MNDKKSSSNTFPEPYETIAIDSDSDNSTDTASHQGAVGDDDSNSNSNFSALTQGTKTGSNHDKAEELATLELKKISLDAHGTFMADFDPEKSKREIRKMNRRLNTKGSKKCRLYDEKGALLESLKDLCDCLQKDCPGCHFPCPRCGSAKCGTDCRCNRKYTIDFIDVEGTGLAFSFPMEYKG